MMKAVRIAALDADADYRSLLGDVLSDAGYDRYLLCSGMHACPRVLAADPCGVVIDVPAQVAPWEQRAVDAMVTEGLHSGRAIVACVANTPHDRGYALRLQNEGCWILLKPYAMDDLLAVLKQALDHVSPNICLLQDAHDVAQKPNGRRRAVPTARATAVRIAPS